MDLEALLKTHGDDAPSGENLEYDPAFTEMELAAQPGEERQVGDQIQAAEDPDYRDVTEKAIAVMERSHDLRAGVYYAEAILHTKGLPGFADATTYLRGCLEEHWDTCHPELDEDDDNDPTMRINSIQNLAETTTVLRALRRAPLTDSRAFGKLCLRDIEIADGVITAPEDMANIPDSATVSAAFQDTDDDQLAEMLTAVKAAMDNVKAIDAVFGEQTPGQGPELDALIKMLNQIAKRLAAETGGDVAEDADTAEEDAGPAPAAGGGAIGGINSPSDVSNAIDRMVAYYQRNEPSSPVPILLIRAKRLVNADFLTIMKDMAPAGVDSVNLIGGLDDED